MSQVRNPERVIRLNHTESNRVLVSQEGLSII
jgi:hypothetical protein